MKTVLLCTENGQSLGTEEIIQAHTNGGKLHKAFSIVIFNTEKTKILIHKRAEAKMLWSGYWTNACCSHPKEKKPLEEEAQIRLHEECGFTCPLTMQSTFTYKADDPNGNGTEHEYDTVLFGSVDEDITLDPDPEEIAEMRWVSIEDLKKDMAEHAEIYTPWFHHIMNTLP